MSSEEFVKRGGGGGWRQMSPNWIQEPTWDHPERALREWRKMHEQREWYFIAEQPAPAPHLAHPNVRTREGGFRARRWTILDINRRPREYHPETLDQVEMGLHLPMLCKDKGPWTLLTKPIPANLEL